MTSAKPLPVRNEAPMAHQTRAKTRRPPGPTAQSGPSPRMLHALTRKSGALAEAPSHEPQMALQELARSLRFEEQSRQLA
jgi:hypothetical protein